MFMNWLGLGIYKIISGKWNKDMMVGAFTTASCTVWPRWMMGSAPCSCGGVWAPNHKSMCLGTLAQVRPIWEFLSFTHAVTQYSVHAGFHKKCFHCGPFKLLRVPLYGVNQWWKAMTKSTGTDTANNVGTQEENKHSRTGNWTEKDRLWNSGHFTLGQITGLKNMQ